MQNTSRTPKIDLRRMLTSYSDCYLAYKVLCSLKEDFLSEVKI